MAVKQRILIVDDDPSIQDVLDQLLTDEGYQVVTVADGVAAFAVLPQYQPHLLIVDLWMAGLSGPAFVQRYQQQPPPHAQVVVFSAAQDGARIAADLGAAFVAKPTQLDALIAVVAQQLRSA
jgi:DNA-binding NtrC family response regulator